MASDGSGHGSQRGSADRSSDGSAAAAAPAAGSGTGSERRGDRRLSFVGRSRDARTGLVSKPRLFGGLICSIGMTRSIGEGESERKETSPTAVPLPLLASMLGTHADLARPRSHSSCRRPQRRPRMYLDSRDPHAHPPGGPARATHHRLRRSVGHNQFRGGRKHLLGGGRGGPHAADVRGGSLPPRGSVRRDQIATPVSDRDGYPFLRPGLLADLVAEL